jgi:serine/threonine protein kinase
MSATFEQILCAIAVKNRLVTHEEARDCLAIFEAQPLDKPARPVVEFFIERGIITLDQAAALNNAAKKVFQQQVTQILGGRGDPFADAPRPGAAPPAPAPVKKETTRAVPSGPPSANPQEPVPGYRIAGKLGVGGTATVFLAEDRRNGNRKVALKILHPSKSKDEKALASFLREADLLVKFNHPNLCKGYACGQAGPLAWVAMEYLEGESVQDVIDREKKLKETRSLEIILETAKALEYIQQQGIVHRDIKPGNIMVLASGAVKVCDLGFAIPIGSAEAPVEEETTSGTVQYMAPEQARGAADIDIRADIYALGASLYHMIMGEVPFQGGDSLEVMAKQVLEALNSSEIKNRRISRHMHYFIERMMSKDKNLRYATPKELIDDINEQIEGFRSLEFRPDEEARRNTTVLRGLSGQPPPASPDARQTTRRFRQTGRFQRPEDPNRRP